MIYRAVLSCSRISFWLISSSPSHLSLLKSLSTRNSSLGLYQTCTSLFSPRYYPLSGLIDPDQTFCRQPHDFLILLDTLEDPTFFPDLSEEDVATLKELVTRWRGFIADGRFKLSVPAELKMGESSVKGQEDRDQDIKMAECTLQALPYLLCRGGLISVLRVIYSLDFTLSFLRFTSRCSQTPTRPTEIFPVHLQRRLELPEVSV